MKVMRIQVTLLWKHDTASANMAWAERFCLSYEHYCLFVRVCGYVVLALQIGHFFRSKTHLHSILFYSYFGVQRRKERRQSTAVSAHLQKVQASTNSPDPDALTSESWSQVRVWPLTPLQSSCIQPFAECPLTLCLWRQIRPFQRLPWEGPDPGECIGSCLLFCWVVLGWVGLRCIGLGWRLFFSHGMNDSM